MQTCQPSPTGEGSVERSGGACLPVASEISSVGGPLGPAGLVLPQKSWFRATGSERLVGLFPMRGAAGCPSPTHRQRPEGGSKVIGTLGDRQAGSESLPMDPDQLPSATNSHNNKLGVLAIT